MKFSGQISKPMSFWHRGPTFTPLLCLILLLPTLPSQAGTTTAKPPRGTASEAQMLVKRAVLAVREDREKAFQSFNDTKGNFVDRDLYILVQDFNGMILAHGANARLIGKNILDVRDLEGRAMIKERIDAAKHHATGWWSEYKWPNPVTKAIERKRAYCELADAATIICSGIYVR